MSGPQQLMFGGKDVLWTERACALPAVQPSGYATTLRGIAGDGGAAGLAAVGITQTHSFDNKTFMYSTDNGRSWNQSSGTIEGSFTSAPAARPIGYGNGVFVAHGAYASGKFLRSMDAGATWAESSSSCSNQIATFAYGNGVFVGVTYQGDIWRSTDSGATWSSTGQYISPVTNNYVQLDFDGTNFIVTTAGYIKTSSDGAAWASRACPLTTSDYPRDIACSSSASVISCGRKLLRSLDHGASWGVIDLTSLISRDLMCLAYTASSGGLFIGLSDLYAPYQQYEIVSSDQGASWSVKSNNLPDCVPMDLCSTSAGVVGVFKKGSGSYTPMVATRY